MSAAPAARPSRAWGAAAEHSAGGGVSTQHKVLAQVSDAEFAVLAGAAECAGLAVGAWLGAVVQDPDTSPAGPGTVYAAVVAPGTRVGTLLGQIQAPGGRWGWPRWAAPGCRWMPRSGSRWTWRT